MQLLTLHISKPSKVYFILHPFPIIYLYFPNQTWAIYSWTLVWCLAYMYMWHEYVTASWKSQPQFLYLNHNISNSQISAGFSCLHQVLRKPGAYDLMLIKTMCVLLTINISLFWEKKLCIYSIKDMVNASFAISDFTFQIWAWWKTITQCIYNQVKFYFSLRK